VTVSLIDRAGGVEPGEGGRPAAVCEGVRDAAHPQVPPAPLREPQQAATEPPQVGIFESEPEFLDSDPHGSVLNSAVISGFHGKKSLKKNKTSSKLRTSIC